FLCTLIFHFLCICNFCLQKVDCKEEIGILRRSELYNNTSLLRTPSNKIAAMYKKEIGITKIMRCWLTIDDYWNISTNKYNYNFKCGWDLNQWDNFYDYMERCSAICDEILLNVRGFHREVVEGKITMKQWRLACKNGIKNYKQRFPKIKYIEALNEYEQESFGGLNNDEYYKFYKEFYKIINEINAELKPNIPLLIGGPCIVGGSLIDGKKKENMRDFFNNYAKDSDPFKKLSFISYHEYHSVENPSILGIHESLIDQWAKEYGIPTNLPIYITEAGDNSQSRWKTLIEDNQLLQATCMASQFYFYNLQPDIQAFQWVIQHKNQDRKNQIYDNLRWSPYGISLKMQARLAKRQIRTETPDLVKGKGIYCLAAKDSTKITLLIWNYQWEDGNKSFVIKLDLKDLPLSVQDGKHQIKEYLLDLKHNNIHTDYPLLSKSEPNIDQLTITRESKIPKNKEISYTISLERNAMCLLEIVPE
ncbi:MAG: hypothetical protein WCK18_18170, partial [Prolixibacteraceae bacterium]